VSYASGSWLSFGTTGNGAVSKQMLPGSYQFRMQYGGGTTYITQNIGLNPTVLFQTTLVSVRFVDGSGAGLSGGVVSYASGSWLSFGTTGNGAVSKQMLPGSYQFRMQYGGGTAYITQDIGLNPTVTFKIVTLAITECGDSWIDSTLPTLIHKTPGTSLDLGDTAYFNFSVSGGIGPYTIKWYVNGIYTGSSAIGSQGEQSQWTYKPTAVGTYSIYASIKDSNQFSTSINPIIIKVNPPLTITAVNWPSGVWHSSWANPIFNVQISGGTGQYTLTRWWNWIHYDASNFNSVSVFLSIDYYLTITSSTLVFVPPSPPLSSGTYLQVDFSIADSLGHSAFVGAGSSDITLTYYP
jgi:hypothetical protein